MKMYNLHIEVSLSIDFKQIFVNVIYRIKYKPDYLIFNTVSILLVMFAHKIIACSWFNFRLSVL